MGARAQRRVTEQQNEPVVQAEERAPMGAGGDFHEQAAANGNAWAQQQLSQGGDGADEATGDGASGGFTRAGSGAGGGADGDGASTPGGNETPGGAAGPGGGGGGAGGASGVPAPSGGGGSHDGGGGAAQRASEAPQPAAGGTVAERMSHFASSTPTQQASTWPALGADLGALARQESAEFNDSVPEVHATLDGAEADAETNEGAVMPTLSGPLEGEDAAPAPEPEITPTPELGAFQVPRPSLQLRGAAEGEGPNPANARAVDQAIGEVPTHDASIRGDPGPEPQVPLEGETDPERMLTQRQSGADETERARADAERAILASPGVACVQPLSMDEACDVQGLAEAEVAETPQLSDMEEYLALGLPGDVTASFDELYGPEMQASLAQAQAQVDDAVSERDSQQQAELERAETDAAALVREAQSDQEAEVAEQRSLIEAERQSTLDAQRQAAADVDAQVRAEHGRVDGQVRDQIRSEQARIDQEFSDAERDANARIHQGEQDAAREKRDAERESEDQSWWERAASFISDCIHALTEAISEIFDAVREAVSGLLDAVKELAADIIDGVCSFICDAIQAFGEFLKDAIQGLLGELFPELADALCDFVDGAVAYAQEKVQQLADDLKAGIEALCDFVEGALNAILDVFQAALDAALTFAEALITGDWTQILLKVLEAALRLCGISPDEFYAFVGRAEETIELIVDDPGGFLGNCISAVGEGFGQFSDNFLSHLQTGFVDWLTGQAGDAGITMPDQLDVAGVFSIVAQVLGLTREDLRDKVEEHFGENAAQAFELAWDFIATLIDGGMDGLWEQIGQHLDGLWDMVIGQIQEFLLERVVMAAVSKLATMWNPVGALVQAVMTAWNLYQWVQAQAQRIFGIIRAVVDGIGDIARGSIGGAASMIEGALAGMIPVGIDLLANLIGLGGVGAKVREIIEQVQGWVSEGIDKMIERLKGMFGGGAETNNDEGDDAPSTPDGDREGVEDVRAEFSMSGAGHELFLEVVGEGLEARMASNNPGDIEDKKTAFFSDIDRAIASERLPQSVRDELVTAKGEVEGALSGIASLPLPELIRLLQAQKRGEASDETASAQLETAKHGAVRQFESVGRQLQAAAVRHGIKDLSDTAAEEAEWEELERVREEIHAAFKDIFEAVRSDLEAALPSGASIKYRGSLASGWKNPKPANLTLDAFGNQAATLFNPHDFDLDAFIEVNKDTWDEIEDLYPEFAQSNDGPERSGKAMLSDIPRWGPASDLEAVRDDIKTMIPSYEVLKGYRTDESGFADLDFMIQPREKSQNQINQRQEFPAGTVAAAGFPGMEMSKDTNREGTKFYMPEVHKELLAPGTHSADQVGAP